MAEIIPCKRTEKGLRYRVWSTVVDAYCHDEEGLTEADLRRWLGKPFMAPDVDQVTDERASNNATIEGEDMTTEDDQVTETIDFAAIRGPTEQLVTMAEGLETSGLNRASILASYLSATIVVKHLIGMDDDDFRMLVDYLLDRARLMLPTENTNEQD